MVDVVVFSGLFDRSECWMQVQRQESGVKDVGLKHDRELVGALVSLHGAHRVRRSCCLVAAEHW